jgi:hypothetical protein
MAANTLAVLLTCLCLTTPSAGADQNTDVVHLRDGAQVVGAIVQHIPEDFIAVRAVVRVRGFLARHDASP